MLEWFVLRTHYQQEKRAHFEFQKQGIKSFFPLARTEYRRKSDGLLLAKVEPLFPRYLFVQIRWEDRRPVMYTRGIKEFVGWAPYMDKAPVVPKPVIRELKSRLEEVLGLDVLILDRPEHIAPGDVVRILCGPFRDHLAPVKSFCGDRVELLLNLFGVITPVKLPKDILSKGREGVSRISLKAA